MVTDEVVGSETMVTDEVVGSETMVTDEVVGSETMVTDEVVGSETMVTDEVVGSEAVAYSLNQVEGERRRRVLRLRRREVGLAWGHLPLSCSGMTQQGAETVARGLRGGTYTVDTLSDEGAEAPDEAQRNGRRELVTWSCAGSLAAWPDDPRPLVRLLPFARLPAPTVAVLRRRPTWARPLSSL